MSLRSFYAPGKMLSVLDIVSKTLKYVKSVAIPEINKTLLSNVDDTDIQWVLTVPAIWTDVAKVMTHSFSTGPSNL
jgi:hypothetical protein